MSGLPVDLDAHRCFAEMKATEIRRQRRHEDEVGEKAPQGRREPPEAVLFRPAENWFEAAAKAQYLLRLFSASAEAQAPERKALIARTLDDLARLCEGSEEHG